MRLKMRALALGVLATALLIGCGQSTDQIGETVKTSMQQKFDSDAQFKEWHLSVTRVQVLKQSENRYQGMATVVYEGDSHDVPVDITADGSNVMWQTPSGSFMFVALKEFQKLEKSLLD